MKKLIKRLVDWQHWPFYLFYFPIGYAWVVYYIKSRSLWFYTASNPTLAFGGFEGEGKSEMYRQLPQEFCPRSIFIDPSMSFPEVSQLVRSSGMPYPFIVKPDVGMKGILFRKIANEHQLQKYHQHMPARYIIQEFVDMPYEVSVFYCRKPGDKKGEITALIQKDLLEVTGDGSSTLEMLIQQHPYAKSFLSQIKKQGIQLNKVLAEGEHFCLSHIGNLFNGARFINMHHKCDEELLDIFDRISHNNQFYYGRYDIKCVSIDDMKKGKNFVILEFNGAGSVPNHIYTGTYTLMGAYKEILKHWDNMYQISADNRKKGIEYWGLKKGYQFLQNSKKHFKVLKQVDKELVLE